MGGIVFTHFLMDWFQRGTGHQSKGTDMDEPFEGVEDNYNDDAAYEAEVSEGSGLMGKVLGGLLAVGTIAGGAAIYKNKDAIKAKIAEAKNRKKAKKVQKHLNALTKLGYQPETKADTEE